MARRIVEAQELAQGPRRTAAAGQVELDRRMDMRGEPLIQEERSKAYGHIMSHGQSRTRCRRAPEQSIGPRSSRCLKRVGRVGRSAGPLVGAGREIVSCLSTSAFGGEAEGAIGEIGCSRDPRPSIILRMLGQQFVWAVPTRSPHIAHDWAHSWVRLNEHRPASAESSPVNSFCEKADHAFDRGSVCTEEGHIDAFAQHRAINGDHLPRKAADAV